MAGQFMPAGNCHNGTVESLSFDDSDAGSAPFLDIH